MVGRAPTTWTIFQQDGPNQLGLWHKHRRRGGRGASRDLSVARQHAAGRAGAGFPRLRGGRGELAALTPASPAQSVDLPIVDLILRSTDCRDPTARYIGGAIDEHTQYNTDLFGIFVVDTFSINLKTPPRTPTSWPPRASHHPRSRKG